MVLPIPPSREALAKLQSERKVIAVENAKKAPFFKGKLDHIDMGKLDDPDEWRKIPLLEKDELRAIPNDHFSTSSASRRALKSPSFGARAAAPASPCSTRARSRISTTP